MKSLKLILFLLFFTFLNFNNVFGFNRLGTNDSVEGGTSLTYGIEYNKLNENDQNIFSITGYNHPPRLMEIPIEYQDDVYFCPRAHCWGWATWVDRLNKTDWEVRDFQILLQDKKKQKKCASLH